MHRGKRDTARLALVSLAGTASATRATLLQCCHLQQRQENRARPSLVSSPQLQPSARLAPKQQGARCSRGDEGKGQAFIPAEDRGIGNKARVAGAATKEQEEHPRALHFSQVVEKTVHWNAHASQMDPKGIRPILPSHSPTGSSRWFEWKRQQGAPGKD